MALNFFFQRTLPLLLAILTTHLCRGVKVLEFKKIRKGILVAVKEQRVDDSYCIHPTQRLQSNLVAVQLRCTLAGFERNYQFKIPSNQLNKALFSTSIQDPKLKYFTVKK